MMITKRMVVVASLLAIVVGLTGCLTGNDELTEKAQDMKEEEIVKPQSFTQDSSSYIVDDFIDSTMQATHLLQKETEYNHSCGPTALLFIDNLYAYRAGYCPFYTSSLNAAKAEIDEIYSEYDLGNPRYDGTNIYKVKDIAIEKYGLSAAIASQDWRIDHSLDIAIGKFKSNIPLILYFTPDNNLFSNKDVDSYRHQAIAYGYKDENDSKTLLVFDPYEGETVEISAPTRDELESDLSTYIQGGGFSWLRVSE